MVNVLEVCLKENDSKSAGDIFEVFDGLFMMVSLPNLHNGGLPFLNTSNSGNALPV